MAAIRDNKAGLKDVVIARIVRPRGLKGELVCDISTDFPERFATLKRAAVTARDGSRLDLEIEAYWFHKGRVILKFEGYDTMTAAEQLRGGLVVIAESEAAPLGQGEFYEYAVVGSEAVTVDGKKLGVVTGLIRTGGTDILVVKNSAREYLIPFADDICVEVDVERGRITVDPPDGLLDL